MIDFLLGLFACLFVCLFIHMSGGASLPLVRFDQPLQINAFSI